MRNQLRWGLVGCGDISRKRVAPALRDLDTCQFVAVSRRHPELAEAFAREFGARKWFHSWEELIADPEIDAVYVASPVYLHEPMTLAAAATGKHVLCEKPMSLTPESCQRMIKACRASNVRLGIAYYRRFYPVLERIRQVLALGRIGDPVLARFEAFEGFNPAPDDPRFWFVQKAYAGGGPMFDFGCHRIEVLIDLFGRCEKVSGITSNVRFTREVEDTAVAVMQFESGTAAIVSVTHAAFEAKDTLTIYGSAGSVYVPSLNSGALELVTPEGVASESHPPHPNLHLPLIEDFTHAVLEGREPRVGGNTGLEVNRILEAIYGPAPGPASQ